LKELFSVVDETKVCWCMAAEVAESSELFI